MSRDRRMREGSSIAATKASAVSWPTPGMVISRRQAAEALVIRLMSASIAATAVTPEKGKEQGKTRFELVLAESQVKKVG
jgi:hypothetical protein